VTADPYDDFHVAIVDATCAADADRAARGDVRWIRAMDPHELCPPGACFTWPPGTRVEVTVLGDGIRIRRPIMRSAA